MVVIIDYGLGNLRSVMGALNKLGVEAVVSSKKEDLEQADKFILPGVGAFGDGMRNLKSLGLIDLLQRLVCEEKKPILGICLGSQLMAKESFEFGHHQGLGWIDASVVRLDTIHLRVPHVGWNNLIQVKKDILFEGIADNELFYFVHSFYVRSNNQEAVTGVCEYGIKFTAALHQDNIYATQFHPEKSQQSGLTLLKNFLTRA